jgi:hypothetical protein
VDRSTALDVLGLDTTSDLDTVKRRFRTLALDLHPDRGGDPHAFHDLQVAYRLLCRDLDEETAPARPRVARGRPSRQRPASSAAPTSAGRSLEPMSGAELQRLQADRRHTLDGELLARLLLTPAPMSRSHRLVSRAPRTSGHTLGRVLPALLDVGVTSSLTFDAGAAGVRVQLTARGRRARRALSDVDMSGLTRAAWTRHRGDAVTVAAADLERAQRSEGGARHVAGAAVELLDALGWPLTSWRIDRGVR